MPLTGEQKLNMLSAARDRWLEAKGKSLAYGRACVTAQRSSNYLKLGTIAAAILTTATSFVEWRWITTTAGLLTATLATAERLFLPAENFLRYSECRSDLDRIVQQIATLSVQLDSKPDLKSVAEPLDQLANEIVSVTRKMPVTVADSDRKEAAGSYQGTTLAQMVKMAADVVNFALPEDQLPVGEIAEDALGVVPVGRG